MRNPAYGRLLSRVLLVLIGVGILVSPFAWRAGWGQRPSPYRPHGDPWGDGSRTIEELPGGGMRATVEHDGLLCSLEITDTSVLVGESITTRLIMANISDHPKDLGEIDVGWLVPDSTTRTGGLQGINGGYRTGPPPPQVTLAPGESTSTIQAQRHDRPAEYAIQGVWTAQGEDGYGLRLRTDSIRVSAVALEATGGVDAQ